MSREPQRLAGHLVSGVHAVRLELEHSVGRARQRLEQYLEGPEDLTPLQTAVQELHQVRGTASVIQCFGVAALAEELKQALQELAQGQATQREALQDASMAGLLQLADYIDALGAGFEDRVLVLQPALNELRIARGRPVLTEEDLFVAQMHALAVELPPAVAPREDLPDARTLARRYLPAYQTALLQWIKGLTPGQNQARIGKIVEQLGESAAAAGLQQLFGAAAGCIEALLSRGLEDSLPLRRAFGRIGVLMRTLAESGEHEAQTQAGDLIYELLFFAGRSRGTGRRVTALSRQYQLDVYLPPAEALDELRRRLRGPGTKLLRRVAEEIRGDLARVKDAVDLAVRTGGRGQSDFAGIRAHLLAIAGALAALGLEILQRIVVQQAEAIAELQQRGAVQAQEWMDFAIAILRIEQNLDQALFRQLRWVDAGGGAAEEWPEQTPSHSDLREGAAGAYRESLVNLARLKTLVDTYVRGGDASLFSEGPRLLQEVVASLRMLEAERPAAVAAALLAHLHSPAAQDLARSAAQAEAFATAVAATEYFIEAQRAGQSDAAQRLEAAERAVARLRDFGAVEPPRAPDARDGDAPAASSVPQQPAPPAPHEVDPVIREVFLEEAAEVIDRLQQISARWVGQPEDTETLGEIRRGFHTLKGSGRMVGAERIAAFAWCLESLLNRCLEGTLAASGAVVDIVRDGVRVLPVLVAAFADDDAVSGTEEAQGVQARAQAIAARREGEGDLISAFRADAAERLAVLTGWVAGQDPHAETFAIAPELLRAFHTLRGAGYVVNVAAIGDLAGALETYLESLRGAGLPLARDGYALIADVVPALRDWVDAVGQAQPEAPDATPWLQRIAAIQSAVPETAIRAAADRQLAEVFAGEAFDLVEAFEKSVNGWQRDPAAEYHLHDLLSALHTLHGAALMSSCPSIAQVALALHRRMEALPPDCRPSPRFFRRLLDIAEQIYRLLDAYREGMRDGDASSALAQIAALDPLEPEAAAPPAGPEPAAAPDGGVEPEAGVPFAAPQAPGAAPVSPVSAEPVVDPELREIFLAEALELLDRIDAMLPALRHEPQDGPALASVQRDLHTLKGSARMAGFAEIGERAYRCERSFDDVLSGRRGFDQALCRELESTVAELRGLVGAPPDAARSDIEMLFSGTESAPPAASTGAAAAVADSGTAAAFEAIERPIDPSGYAAEMAPAALHLDDFDAASAPAEPSEAEAAAPLPTEARQVLDAPPSAEPAHADAGFERPVEPFLAAPDAAPDPELLDIFIAEAGELMEALDRSLAGWRADATDETALRELQRALHTLKGGARMAGLAGMAAAAHEMESQVDAMERGGAGPSASEFEALRGAFESVQRMHDALAQGSQSAIASAPTQPQPAPEEVPSPEQNAGPSWDPLLFWTPDDAAAQRAGARREAARVPVERLDAMLNEAGEISIFRSRLEEQGSALRRALGDMAQTIDRLREQLRLLDLETEAQIAARGFTRSSEDLYETEFDPLEMDRYSRMQELSRALAESVGDLSSLHLTMDGTVADAESVLLQQARANTEVQTALMGTLMVPFAQQLPRLQRVARQTAAENGREVEFAISGQESELDRKVLERMTAPLEHLLRNAVVHGIEPPQVREQAGKPRAGTLGIALRRDGSQLLIEVRDDGRGLDLAAIREAAVRRGLLAADATPTDEQVTQFIFAPGFSTASALTQDAGRGIGMDVVAAEVKQLGGSLQLASEPGRGTRFLVRLPLTLAMAQALLVRVADEVYAIPLSSVDGIARIPSAQLPAMMRDGGEELAYGGQQYPVRYLGDYLGLPFAPDGDVKTWPAVLIRASEGLSGERYQALVVDRLLGNREIVSKAVGPQLASVRGISGATILADGRVVLILDLHALTRERARGDVAVQIERTQQSAVPATGEAPLIMVVDDSITMRRVAERLLLRQGFRVLTAKDGLDAMAMLQTETPAGILLDIEMPRADGFEVAAFARNTGRISHVPIIMITSRSGEKHRDRARRLGVNRYLVKPYQEEQLLAELRAVIAETAG